MSKFYNTRKLIVASGSNLYSFDDASKFSDDISKSRSITIVSAFYNPEYFRELFGKVRKSTRIAIYLPAEHGLTKSAIQKEQLLEIQTCHKKVEVRLIKSNHLLHTKLYMIEKQVRTNGVIKNSFISWIGSSNASTHSLNNCEELMIRMKTSHYFPEALKNYVDELKNLSYDISEKSVNIKTVNLYNFFNQGSLYTKTNEIFNPYIEIDFGDYKNSIVKILKAQSSDFLIAPFVKTTDKMSLLELLKRYYLKKGNNVNDIDPKKIKFEGIKKYGLYTNYGLWIPDGYKSKVEELLENDPSIKQRGRKLQNIYDAFCEIKSAEYKPLIDILEEILKHLAELINKPEDLFLKETKGENSNIRRLKSKIDWCIERLSDKKDNHFLELLLRPYYSSPMPNIWDDEYVVDDFIETFHYSLITEDEKIRHMNLLYQSIKHFNKPDYRKITDSDGLKSIEYLKRLLRYNSRFFCQFDLKNFYKLNTENKGKFNIKRLSDVNKNEIKNGKDVFYNDGTYIIFGQIIAVKRDGKKFLIKCSFEDGDNEFYNVDKTEGLIDIGINP
jgi:hypothetical protein